MPAEPNSQHPDGGAPQNSPLPLRERDSSEHRRAASGDEQGEGATRATANQLEPLNPSPCSLSPAAPLVQGAREEASALAALQARTPARLVVGRAGTSYRTATQLELREDHAAAVDAVRAEMDLARDFGADFLERHALFEVATLAADKSQYLQRPELGRSLSEASQALIRGRCPQGVDLQVAIGDGLSAAAVAAQVPTLLPLLESGAKARGWTFGRPFAVRHCRVGVLNAIGPLLDARVVVLLIGERPGLATAESLSAYMAFRPESGHTDAQRNLVSNIHARGVAPAAAAERILNLAAAMIAAKSSGVAIKESLPAATLPNSAAKLAAPLGGEGRHSVDHIPQRHPQ